MTPASQQAQSQAQRRSASAAIRLSAEGVAGLRDQPRSGRRPRTSEGQRAAPKAVVPRGPDPERDGVSTRRIADLCRTAEERFVGISHRGGGGTRRLAEALGPSWRKTRPSHPKADKAAQERLGKGAAPPPPR